MDCSDYGLVDSVDTSGGRGHTSSCEQGQEKEVDTARLDVAGLSLLRRVCL